MHADKKTTSPVRWRRNGGRGCPTVRRWVEKVFGFPGHVFAPTRCLPKRSAARVPPFADGSGEVINLPKRFVAPPFAGGSEEVLDLPKRILRTDVPPSAGDTEEAITRNACNTHSKNNAHKKHNND